MGRQIITQPDGLFAIYSTVSDSFVAYDCTKQDVIDYFVNEAAEEMAQRISTTLRQIEDEGPSFVYRQFALTFEEANDNHLGNGGEPIRFEGRDWELEICPDCGNHKRVGVECISQHCLIMRDE